jgi:hypothetical protein
MVPLVLTESSAKIATEIENPVYRISLLAASFPWIL